MGKFCKSLTLLDTSLRPSTAWARLLGCMSGQREIAGQQEVSANEKLHLSINVSVAFSV